jgi:hypothetical protein
VVADQVFQELDHPRNIPGRVNLAGVHAGLDNPLKLGTTPDFYPTFVVAKVLEAEKLTTMEEVKADAESIRDFDKVFGWLEAVHQLAITPQMAKERESLIRPLQQKNHCARLAEEKIRARDERQVKEGELQLLSSYDRVQSAKGMSMTKSKRDQSKQITWGSVIFPENAKYFPNATTKTEKIPGLNCEVHVQDVPSQRSTACSDSYGERIDTRT